MMKEESTHIKETTLPSIVDAKYPRVMSALESAFVLQKKEETTLSNEFHDRLFKTVKTSKDNDNLLIEMFASIFILMFAMIIFG